MTNRINSSEKLGRPGEAIRAAIHTLSLAARELQSSARLWTTAVPTTSALKQASEELSRPRALRKPPETGAALIAWREAKRHGTVERLSRRTIRQLTWEPEAVYDVAFQRLVDAQWENLALPARTMQAMVRAYHKNWAAGRPSDPTAEWLAARIRGKIRDMPFIRKWKTEPAAVLGGHGPGRFGRHIYAGTAPVRDIATEWGFDDQTPYFDVSVTEAAVSLALDPTSMETGIDALCGRLLPWASEGLRAERFKALAARVIISPQFAAESSAQKRLQSFVLGPLGLGDPRLPATRARWSGVSPDARTRVLHWLTKADIRLFFETILPDSVDKHGRKPFWLRYTELIQASRPLLTVRDRTRLERSFRGREVELRHIGATCDNSSSAFVLLFPKVLVVEFAVYGRAYFYTGDIRSRLEASMWRESPFAVSELKVMDGFAEAVGHWAGWEKNMANALARFDIRAPGPEPIRHEHRVKSPWI